MDILKPKYNILKIAGSPLGHKHTQEAIDKIRLWGKGRKFSEETRAKFRAARIGRKMPEDIRLKISSTKKKANFKHSESAKLKIGEASLARGWATNVTNITKQQV